MDIFKTIGGVFKALTSNIALFVYAAIAGLWLFNTAMSTGKKWFEDFKHDTQETMRLEFNNIQTKELLEGQKKVLDAIQQGNASQDAALKDIITSGDKRNTQYTSIERKLRTMTDQAVKDQGETQGPQTVSPFMDRALELLDEGTGVEEK